MATMYDCIIVGGGPAGISAGIYLGRFMRSVLLFDRPGGRTTYNQLNENYLGFPRGIHARELMRRARKQAERFHVQFREDDVCEVQIRDDARTFRVVLEDGEETARSIIFATGVTDSWPPFPGVERYIGKSIFWCITCDGFQARDKRVVVLGNSSEAATTALQLLNYTDQVTFLASEPEFKVSAEKQEELHDNNIPIRFGRIVKADGARGQLRALILDDGDRIELDCLFSNLGQVPNSQVAAHMGVALNDEGCIEVDEEQQTNIPGVFAAGDVTSKPSQQVVTAAHQGSLAGISANYFLYPSVQKTLELANKGEG